MSTMRIDKARVMSALKDAVSEELRAATMAHERAVAGAIHDEGRAEHDKDTRATEASYVARGLARRVVEVREVELALEHPAYGQTCDPDGPITSGGLIAVEDEQERVAYYLLAGKGGGFRIEIDGVTVRVVTPASPVGSALLGQRVDDAVNIFTPRGVRELIIIDVW